MMDLDQLQSVRDRERQTDKLQQLRESFYADAADLVAELREERDRAADEAEDPFDDPRVSRLTDQINTAEQTVEAIYEKRVGKLVKAASFAAADLPAETEGMTAEEQDLFDALVADIRANRQRVLDVLAGEGQPADGPAPTGDAGEGSDEVDGVDGVDAASVMGGSDEIDPPAPPEPEEDIFPDADVEADPEAVDASRPAPPSSEEDESVDERGGATRGEPDDGGDSPASDAGDDSEEAEEPPGSEPAPGAESSAVEEPGAPDAEEAAPDVERTTVRITADVGEIFGVDEREYHLEADQIVTLPSANAEPLLEQDAAERVER